MSGNAQAGCPQCPADWDFTGPGRAGCANGHQWDQAPDLPGTFTRPGWPGDHNDPERFPDDSPTMIIPVPRRKRPRWRRWYVVIPAAILAALIGITALGAAVGPYPAAVKATTVKISAAYLP
jgi:hypothetical protein